MPVLKVLTRIYLINIYPYPCVYFIICVLHYFPHSSMTFSLFHPLQVIFYPIIFPSSISFIASITRHHPSSSPLPSFYPYLYSTIYLPSVLNPHSFSPIFPTFSLHTPPFFPLPCLFSPHTPSLFLPFPAAMTRITVTLVFYDLTKTLQDYLLYISRPCISP